MHLYSANSHMYRQCVMGLVQVLSIRYFYDSIIYAFQFRFAYYILCVYLGVGNKTNIFRITIGCNSKINPYWSLISLDVLNFNIH